MRGGGAAALMRGGSAAALMRGLLLDVRFALRALRAAPGVTLPAIVCLALGLGAATTMFSAVDVFMVRPLSFERARDLVVVRGVSRDGAATALSVPDFLDLAGQSGTLELAAWRRTAANLSGPGAERLNAIHATTRLLDVLRTRVAGPVQPRWCSSRSGCAAVRFRRRTAASDARSGWTVCPTP
jgi:hypothetical protein